MRGAVICALYFCTQYTATHTATHIATLTATHYNTLQHILQHTNEFYFRRQIARSLVVLRECKTPQHTATHYNAHCNTLTSSISGASSQHTNEFYSRRQIARSVVVLREWRVVAARRARGSGLRTLLLGGFMKECVLALHDTARFLHHRRLVVSAVCCSV